MSRKKRGESLSHKEVNAMIRSAQEQTRLRSVSHSMTRDGQFVGFPQFYQREAIVVAEDFPLGLAGGADHTYEIRFRYFRQFSDLDHSSSNSSSSSSGEDNLWQTDDRGKPVFMDATNTGGEFEAGDKVTVYFDQQRNAWLPVRSSMIRNRGGGSGCCGTCLPPEFAVITDCGVTDLIPRMRIAFVGTAQIFSGGAELVNLLHVSGCTFESGNFPLIFDFIPDDSDSSPQVKLCFWRAVVASGEHDSTLELREDGGGVILKYRSKTHFDPLCGTEFGIIERVNVFPGLAELAPCTLCLYPYVSPVNGSCLAALKSNIGRTKDWPEFVTLELLSLQDVSGGNYVSPNSQNYQLRFVPGSAGTWRLVSDNPVPNAIGIPGFFSVFNSPAIGFKKLTTLLAQPPAPNAQHYGDPLFGFCLICGPLRGQFSVGFESRYSGLFSGAFGQPYGWLHGMREVPFFGGAFIIPGNSYNIASLPGFDPDDIEISFSMKTYGHFNMSAVVGCYAGGGFGQNTTNFGSPWISSSWKLHIG